MASGGRNLRSRSLSVHNDHHGSTPEARKAKSQLQANIDKLDLSVFFKKLGPVPDTKSRIKVCEYYQLAEGRLREWNQYLLSKPFEKQMEKTAEAWNYLLTYVEYLINAAEKLFEVDMDYYLVKEIYERIWKYGVYPLIKLLRSQDGVRTRSRSWVERLIVKGITHFERMIKAVSTAFKVDLGELHVKPLRMSNKKQLTTEVNAMYRLYILTGDLYRYKYSLNLFSSHRDYAMSKSMYLSARYVDTINSRAYNQLGLLIARSGVKTDGTHSIVYFLTRAAHAPEPADGAEQELTSIYHELIEKYGKQKNMSWYIRSKTAEALYTHMLKRGGVHWLPLSKKSSLPVFQAPVPPTRPEYLRDTPLEQLLDCFNIAFGHFCGIVYTNIGCDHIDEVAKDMMVYFEGIVRNKDYSLLSFYLSVMGMLLFLSDRLHNQEQSTTSRPKKNHKKDLRRSVMDVTMKMIVIIMDKLNFWLHGVDPFKADLHVPLITAIHVWVIWVSKRKDQMKKLRNELKRQLEQFNTEAEEEEASKYDVITDFLPGLYYLCTDLEQMAEQDQSDLIFPSTATRGTSQVLPLLPEHIFLDGFSQILLHNDIDYATCMVPRNLDKEGIVLYQNAYRIEAILEFGKDLFQPAQECDAMFTADANQTGIDADCFYQNEFKVLDLAIDMKATTAAIRDNISEHRQLEPPPADCNTAASFIAKISPDELNKRTDEQEEKTSWDKLKEKTALSQEDEIDQQLVYAGLRRSFLVIPMRIVLDTNTLINERKWVEKLMYEVHSPIIIPTTVLLELRGLAKGAKTGESPRYKFAALSLEDKKQRMLTIMEVGNNCVQALNFLTVNKKFFTVVNIAGEEIRKMNNYLTQRITDKYSHPKVRNDEKILETCVQLEQNGKERQNSTMVLKVSGTVLLTGDRSLRVRAQVQEIQSRDVQSFTEWLSYVNSTERTVPVAPSSQNRFRVL